MGLSETIKEVTDVLKKAGRIDLCEQLEQQSSELLNENENLKKEIDELKNKKAKKEQPFPFAFKPPKIR
jgi:cell division protein FtsB